MNPTFALNIKSLVVKAYVSSKVAQSQGNGAILFTSAEELLADRNITGKILVDAFNEVSPKPVKKFADNKTAARRYMAAIADLHIDPTGCWDDLPATKVTSKPTPQVAALPGMTPLGITPAEAKLADAVVGAKAAFASAKPTKARGAFTGKVINVLVTENPRRENTKEVCGYASFNLLLNHGVDMPYELYIKQGGRAEDLKWDISKGWAEVK